MVIYAQLQKNSVMHTLLIGLGAIDLHNILFSGNAMPHMPRRHILHHVWEVKEVKVRIDVRGDHAYTWVVELD
jgi:hypothetical protein